MCRYHVGEVGNMMGQISNEDQFNSLNGVWFQFVFNEVILAAFQFFLGL